MQNTRRDPHSKPPTSKAGSDLHSHSKAPRGPSRPREVSAIEGRRILNDLHKPVKVSKPPKAV